jgi:hypothetical protein
LVPAAARAAPALSTRRTCPPPNWATPAAQPTCPACQPPAPAQLAGYHAPADGGAGDTDWAVALLEGLPAAARTELLTALGHSQACPLGVAHNRAAMACDACPPGTSSCCGGGFRE